MQINKNLPHQWRRYHVGEFKFSKLVIFSVNKNRKWKTSWINDIELNYLVNREEEGKTCKS